MKNDRMECVFIDQKPTMSRRKHHLSNNLNTIVNGDRLQIQVPSGGAYKAKFPLKEKKRKI